MTTNAPTEPNFFEARKADKLARKALADRLGMKVWELPKSSTELAARYGKWI